MVKGWMLSWGRQHIIIIFFFHYLFILIGSILTNKGNKIYTGAADNEYDEEYDDDF